jgi:ppGpp synthetase/RelA/SpoT-type nucleotidyltranferase
MAQADTGTAPVVSIDLTTFDSFRSHPWLHRLVQRYAEDSVLAKHAAARIAKDLEEINNRYLQAKNRTLFTTIEARVKTETSFLDKIYRLCCRDGKAYGVTQDTLAGLYDSVTDLCGVRFACPYFDEVKQVIETFIRPRLAELGYGTNLEKHKDRDLLDDGDELGYRSYHFFISVPTFINIFGESKLCLCEVQGRSELQHVWAVKSHDLLYKPLTPMLMTDKHVTDDMKQISNNLRAVDQFLVSIRDRVRGGGISDVAKR